MVFFSKIQGRPVIDSSGKNLGTLKDLVFIDGEKYAEISHILYLALDKKRKKIPFSCVKEFKDPKDTQWIDVDVFLCKNESEVTFEEEKEKEFLASSIIDKQLIDVDGIRIVRVNDVLLGKVENKFCIVAVDVGNKGLLRRLGMERIAERFFKNMQDNIIPWEFVEPFDEEMRNLRIKVQRNKIARMHPADIADIMEDLSSKERVLIFNSLDNQTAARTLIEAQPEVQQSVFRNLKTKRIVEILENMPADEAADIIGVMPSFRSTDLLKAMKPEIADKIKKLLQYSSDAAGGLMSTEFITISLDTTAEQTINRMREIAPSSHYTYYLYVIDNESRLVGVLSLRDLIISPPQRKVSEFLISDVVMVHVDTPKEEIYKIINKYNLMVLPVVDSNNKLVGVISADDIIDLMIPQSLKRQRLIVGRRKKRKKPEPKNGNHNGTDKENHKENSIRNGKIQEQQGAQHLLDEQHIDNKEQ